MPDQQNNEPTHAFTPCRNCVFATWEDTDTIFDEGNTQIGCYFDRIDKYREQNEHYIVEAYDEKKNFYVVNGRICNCCRDADWAKQQKKKSLSQLAKQVRQDNKMPFDAIVVAEDNFDDVKLTVDSLIKQEHPPKEITVVRKYGCTISKGKLLGYLNSLQTKWRITSITNPELDERESVDNAGDSTKWQYYVVFKAGFIVPVDYLLNIDIAWNEKLLQLGIVMLEDKQLNGMMVSTPIHKHFGGNRGFDIEYKLSEYEPALLHMYKDII